uniref:Protein kinase domain-containing protein n=1 Tax=Physcomitrium patens TaxID=3218 RepID=A0A7I4DLB7_PHYPA
MLFVCVCYEILTRGRVCRDFDLTDKLQYRGRYLMQAGPIPTPLTIPLPPPPPSEPPTSLSEQRSPPPSETSLPPAITSHSPLAPPLETIPPPVSPPPSSVEPPPSPPKESLPPVVGPELPAQTPTESPPPPSITLSPPSPAHSDVPPPSVPPLTPDSPPPPAVDAVPPSIPDSPPPLLEAPPPPPISLPPLSPTPSVTATPDVPAPSTLPPTSDSPPPPAEGAASPSIPDSPPPPLIIIPPPSPAPTATATPDVPPPSTPPPTLDSPPPPVEGAAPPSILDSPPPQIESPPPPPITISPPSTPPPTSDSPPPPDVGAVPPSIPDTPPPASNPPPLSIPNAPPPSLEVPSPPSLGAPPPTTPDSPPPPNVLPPTTPDSPPPPNASPPTTPDSPPPPNASPPTTPDSPPPPNASPPTTPDSPPPPNVPPPTTPDSPPPSISPPPTLTPPSIPVDPPSSQPPAVSPPPPVSIPPSEPPTNSPSPPAPIPFAPNPSPTTSPSPPSTVFPPPSPSPPSPPPSSPDSPPSPIPPNSSPPDASPPPPRSPSPPDVVSPPSEVPQPAAPPSTQLSPPAARSPTTVSPPLPSTQPPPPRDHLSPPAGAPPPNSILAPPPPSIFAPPPYALAPGPGVQGCCAPNMMLQPGSLGTIQCRCVYPVTVKLQFINASSDTPNLQEIFQYELASQLKLLDVQVFVNYFKFGENSSFSVKAGKVDGPMNVESDIGPISGISFSVAEISRINQTIWSGKVKFNETYFGDYSVISVTPEFIPPTIPVAPPPVITSQPSHEIAPTPSKSSSTALYAGIGSGVGAVLLCLVIAFCIWNSLHSRKRNEENDTVSSSKVSALQSHQLAGALPSRWVPVDSKSFPRPKQTREFTYEELSEATNGFAPSAFIGEGGFGKVYKGILRDGTEVAIKKLTTGGHQGDREFLVEVEMLSRLHHRNLVKLLGYFCCREPLVQLLCYELIPNGSVDSWLHGTLCATFGPLDWPTRMKIAIGSARGLQYLHEDSQPCVIHRDFKASNILLQNNFHAKVADFGLARLAPEGQGNYVSTRVMGTFGYVAPEYAMTGHLLVKSDVYSYGVVLLELLSGRRPIDHAQEAFENITAWARPLLTDSNRIHELADPLLDGKYPTEDFEQVAALAKSCIEPEWRARPTMGEVVASLNQICWSGEYNTSSDVERASSEHETGNLQSVGLPRISNSTSTSSNSSSAFSMPWPGDRRPPFSSYAAGIGPSAFTPNSSNQFTSVSGLVDDSFSKTNIVSEDLQEGR